MASEPLGGKRIASVTDFKRKQDWAQFMKCVALEYKHAEKITLIMDNYGTHNIGSFYDAFSPEEAKALVDRFEIIFTPKHGSWLNMAEIELSVLQRQCLDRRISEIGILRREVDHWVSVRNTQKSRINWHFTTKDSRIKLKRLYPSIDV